jgi:hypothetical protein
MSIDKPFSRKADRKNREMIDENLTDEEIDIVYTWVDGSDPLFISERKRFAGHCESCNARDISFDNRFRDSGELLFSLRSIDKFAPWVRRIYIVTNGQVPAWLNMDCARISLVTHKQIFSNPDHLPVFNSNAIELQLHRIPGLSRRFLYLNDDIFLCKPIYPSDFIDSDFGQYFFFDDILLPIDCDNGRVHDRAYSHTQIVARQLQPMGQQRRLPSHCPQLYDKDVLFRLEEFFFDAFIETSSHRFRDPKDIVLRILYFIYLLETSERDKGHKPKTLKGNPDEYMFLMLSSRVWSSVMWLAAAGLRRPRFLCINDDIEMPGKGGIPGFVYRYFLRRLFPSPSMFEKK